MQAKAIVGEWHWVDDGELPSDIHLILSLDYEEGVLYAHPGWIRECHLLGMEANVWTVNKEEDMRHFIEKGADYITTNEPVLLQQIIFGK